MIKIEQTKTDGLGGGNCVAACIASIFEVDIESVSVPCGGSYTAIVDWTNEHYPGLFPVEIFWNRHAWIELKDIEPPTPLRSYYIATVVSPRTGGFHCVVMYGKDLAWDPHPLAVEGVGRCAGYTYWILRDPGKLTAYAAA